MSIHFAAYCPRLATRLNSKIMKLLKRIILIAALPAWLLPAACSEDENADDISHLTVEGWITDGGYPVVLLGETQSLDKGTLNTEAYAVRWGKVTISDGTNEVILTGGYDGNYFPPYKYTPFNMTGQAGKTYRLTAEYNGKKVRAVTTIPHRVPLDSLRIVGSKSDDLFYIKAFFKDNRNERNYYGLFSKREKIDKTFFLSRTGVFSDEIIPELVAADVYRGTSFSENANHTSSSYFRKGDMVQVQLCHMDSLSFRFWKSYSNYINLSSNMFFPYTNNLESNIEGGKGYWCGYGTSTLTIVIR